jgi:hypothetical protein
MSEVNRPRNSNGRESELSTLTGDALTGQEDTDWHQIRWT